MDKTSQFIQLVQTGLIAHYAASKDHDHPRWAVSHLARAFEIASRIPAETTALVAAEAFLDESVGGLSQEERAKLPTWLFDE